VVGFDVTATVTPSAETLSALLRDSAPETKTPGLQLVLVDRSGIRLELHTGHADLATNRLVDSTTTFMAYSMSKTITAAAVLQLVDTKAIALDDPLNRYLPWQPYGRDVTIRHLLAHTGGIPNPIPLRWVHPAERDEDFDAHGALVTVLVHHGRPTGPPGHRFAYSNIGYWLLGEVIADVTAQPFATYVTSHVLARVGIPSSALSYSITDPAHHASGYLERYSLLNLFKRLLIDHEYIGAYNGRWLRIRDHFVDGAAFGGLVGSALGFGLFLQDQLGEHSRLFSDTTCALFYEQQRVASGRAIPMTLGWHIGDDFYYKEGGGGGFHCMMRVYPKAGLGMVVMSNATAFDVRGLLDRAFHGATTP